MNKLKCISQLFPIVPLVIAIYVACQCAQGEQAAKRQLTEMTSQLEQLQQTIEKNNQIIADKEYQPAHTREVWLLIFTARTERLNKFANT